MTTRFHSKNAANGIILTVWLLAVAGLGLATLLTYTNIHVSVY